MSARWERPGWWECEPEYDEDDDDRTPEELAALAHEIEGDHYASLAAHAESDALLGIFK